jgi:hypothetical protein
MTKYLHEVPRGSTIGRYMPDDPWRREWQVWAALKIAQLPQPAPRCTEACGVAARPADSGGGGA